MSDSLWSHGLQYARLPCPSLSPGVYPSSCPLSQWCHPTIHPMMPVNDGIQWCHPLSSLSPFPFNVSQHQSLFQCVGWKRWPKFWDFSLNISHSSEYQGWFPLGLTGLISLRPRDSQESSVPPVIFEKLREWNTAAHCNLNSYFCVYEYFHDLRHLFTANYLPTF